MAGGEGAKDRRRLKRSKESDDTKAETTHGRTDWTAKKRNGPSKDSRLWQDQKSRQYLSEKRRDFGGKSKSACKIDRRPGELANGLKHVVTKSKKPKHLKRKLEQASEDDNEQAREALCKKLKEWEERKAELMQRSKRQKRVPSNHEPVKKSSNVTSIDKVEDGPSHSQQDKHPKGHGTTGKQDHLIFCPLDRSNSETSPQLDDGIEHFKTVDVKTNDTSHEENSEFYSANNNFANGAIVEKKDRAKKSVDGDLDDFSEDNSYGKSDDDDASEMGGGCELRRQRGSRRRGRKDTSKRIEETQTEKQGTTALEATHDALSDGGPSMRKSNSLSIDDDAPDKSEQGRYCIGRKPVTDFILGHCYPAKVVYVKPFGIFLDIGCHSDAFCHVSRLSDEFVESPETLFKQGDQVPKARVVEIDRKQKRITVSLQSESRLQDERASIEARKVRNETRRSKSLNKLGHSQTSRKDGLPNEAAETEQAVAKNESQRRSDSETSFAKTRDMPHRSTKPGDPSIMSPAEQKRARKLTRRAARRDQVDPSA